MSNIASDVKIKGTIKFGKEMLIDGHVDGEIITEEGELVVSETGTIKASLNVRSAVIEGSVEGNITATDKVLLKQNAHITGDLQAGKLAIEDGVVFIGKCNVNPEGFKVER